MHIEKSYSTLLNKCFAHVIKINLYVSKLFHYEISDEKKICLNRAFEANVESREPLTSFSIMAFASLKHSKMDAILKSLPITY